MSPREEVTCCQSLTIHTQAGEILGSFEMFTYGSTITLSDEVVMVTGSDDQGTFEYRIDYNAELFGLPEPEPVEEESEEDGDEEGSANSAAASLLAIGASLMAYLQ